MKELQAALDPEEEKEVRPVHDVSESDDGGLEWQVINEKLLLISSAANIRRKEIQSSCKRDLEDCKDNLGVLDLQETKELIESTMEKDPRGIQARKKHIHSLEKWNDTGMWEEIVKEGEVASEK